MKTVERLIAEGANVNGATEDNLHSPLHLAVEHGHLAVVQCLIEKGADVHARHLKSGQVVPGAPFYYAASHGFVEIARLLLKRGADVNARSPMGVTGLMNAAGQGHLKMVEFLIQARADIEAKDSDNFTAAHHAALYGQAETFEALARAGADINAQGIHGNRPLDLALHNHGKNKILIDRLRALGARSAEKGGS